MGGWLERLKTVTPDDQDGGQGEDVQTAVDEIKGLREELTTLRAEQDTTLDGVPVRCGMVVYVHGKGIYQRINYTLTNPGESDGFDPDNCCSTREAAEAKEKSE